MKATMHSRIVMNSAETPRKIKTNFHTDNKDLKLSDQIINTKTMKTKYGTSFEIKVIKKLTMWLIC